jgi:hypothetical protein
MSEKLICQIATHVSHTTAAQLRGLSALADKSPSQYVRDILMKHLDEERSMTSVKHEIFEMLDQDGRTESTERTDG